MVCKGKAYFMIDVFFGTPIFRIIFRIVLYCYVYLHIWGFPKMVVPNNHELSY